MLKFKLIPIVLLLASMGSFAQQATPQWQPNYHFTAPSNWLNDPNGLIYLNGEFQLYYQYNPFENKWGHMSWGHATSKDLVNWKHLPVAIPEKITNDTTTMIFSGSAVLDKNNVSGLGNGKAPLLAFYTADLPKQHNESQYMAYSNDGGLTFTNYAKNPVIDLNKKDFRDPNVWWHEASKQWIMTVAMVDEHQARFYGSTNLKDWTMLSDFGKQGNQGSGWECPFIIPLAVDGNKSNTKWVLVISLFGPKGPTMQYFVGDFDGKTFKNDNDEKVTLLVDDGDSFYAGIPWNDTPKNQRILLGWLQPGGKETFPWKGQMSIPRDLSLKTTGDGVRLFQQPTNIISDNLKKHANGKAASKQNVALDGNVDFGVSQNSYWIDAEFSVNEAKNFGFKIAQLKDDKGNVVKEIEVGYDVTKKQLYVDCSRSEKGIKNDKNIIQTATVNPKDGKIKLQVLLDKSSLEVFGNGGEKVITTMVFPDEKATGFSAFSIGGKAVLNNLKVWDLSKRK
ncbi:glycoside hydrolase family 32 protein [Pedobacter fastidiosus]|uniref:Glycoside hydrolase family 32 protein n=1 Tax=Pedobacter fastidiosus TaxID=2765361 RepID=A0ABR7KLJ5_9SPHI|nr:glycoside hydrolase family 32 protein [Pedobacter fastidiosus]MBC6108868.1 glycoside hydrolase family 32 protein [Pedobacter fastidiosus]